MNFVCKQAIGYILMFSVAASGLQAQSLQLDFIDKDTGEAVSCRVEPAASSKRFPKTRSSLISGNTILFEQTAKLKPATGKYEFTATRGIEFADIDGGFEIDKDTRNKFDVIFQHSTKMNEANWFSGDLGGSLPAKDLSRWAAADALNLTVSLAKATLEPTATVNSTNPLAQPAEIAENSSTFATTIESYRIGSEKDLEVVLHPIRPGTSLPEAIANAASPLECVDQIAALDRSDWIVELSNITARDIPIALALFQFDAAQVLSRHLQRNTSVEQVSTFYNPDPKRFQGNRANGWLAEYVYWQMLEAGLKTRPSAASHFQSDGKTIVGYNRIYAWIDPQQPRDAATWWKNYREGFSFFTNGPLLRVTVNGGPPGQTLSGVAGQPIYTDLQAELTVRDEVDYLDIIYNGQTKYQAKLEEHARRGRFPELPYTESGWMIVRVVTSHADSYRYASTAPTFIEFDGKTRISRKAVQFFQAWLAATKADIQADGVQAERYKLWLTKAQRFWTERALSANAP